jgi:hypothetical protein
MMIKGTVTGITSLKTSLSEGEEVMGEDIKNLIKELIAIEEASEKRLKKYL